jgi:hypothetical protein
MDSSLSERRRYARVEESVCAWLSFGGDFAAYGTLSADLGVQGARFSALRRVDVKERVVIYFDFPSKTVGCEAEVRWAKPASNGWMDFGVRFMKIDGYERDYLERFLTRTAAA